MNSGGGFHGQIRRFSCAPDGRQMMALGVRVGWWPCLNAVFLQVAFLYWRAEVWFGQPTKNERLNGRD